MHEDLRRVEMGSRGQHCGLEWTMHEDLRRVEMGSRGQHFFCELCKS